MFTPEVCNALGGTFNGGAAADDAVDRVIIVGIEVSREHEPAHHVDLS